MKLPQRDDSGIALFTALLVILVTTVLAISAVSVAMHALNTTVVDRNRTQALDVAEGALNSTVYQLENAGPSMPCTVAGGSLNTTPGPTVYSITVNYYATNPPTGSPLSCTSGSTLTSTPASADIVAEAWNSHNTVDKRSMEALLKFTPVTGSAFTDAIFGQQVITISNHSTVSRSNGSTTANANVYSNSAYVCSNNQTIDGSVYSQSTITFDSGCSAQVNGSLEAVGNVSTASNVTIKQNVESTGGNVSLSGNTSVLGSVYAAGTASGGTVTGVTSSGVSPPVFPIPNQSFPQLQFIGESAAWTAAGYTIVTNNDCTNDAGSVYNQLNVTTNTVVVTSCALSWANKTSITLSANLVIFADGGFSTVNNFSVDSNNASTPRWLELIVPDNDASSCTSSPDVNFSNNTQLGNGLTPSDIDTFIYTPCNLSIANKNAFWGQIYAGGTVTVNNNFSMVYTQSTQVFGAANPPTTSYNLSYEFTREIAAS
jgi:hypothetical protein